ncbi:MAG: hypothetical protein U9R79_15220 [Armatimonadota bacterium]|nr:hypothetical protein [Armatimonadota bacterium]
MRPVTEYVRPRAREGGCGAVPRGEGRDPVLDAALATLKEV